jgi:hypothetical protein
VELNTVTELELRQYGHGDLATVRQMLLDVHASVPENSPDDPFVERFPWFVDHWGGHPVFTRAPDRSPGGSLYLRSVRADGPPTVAQDRRVDKVTLRKPSAHSIK